MKKLKRVLCVFLIVLAFLQPSSVSKAAPSGCPSEWSIPKNLFDASVEQRKELLTPDFFTVIQPSRDAEYSFDGVTWVKVKNGSMRLPRFNQGVWQDPLFERNSEIEFLTNFFSNRFDDITLINLGDMSWINQNKIYIRTSVEISKQNCASSATYYYQQEFAPPGIETKNFESEATKIKNTFQNYQVFDLFSQQYKNCIIKWQSYNNSTQVRKPLDPCFLSNPPNVTVIKLEPDKPGCLVFLPGNVNTPSGVGIKQGTKCSYTILGFNGDPPYVSPGQRGLGATGGRISSHYNIRTGNLVSFGKLTINSPVNSSTITCVKGKVAKKVTAIKPKCPAGYKKK